MSPIIPIALFAAGAIALSLAKTVRAAKGLGLNISKFGIYNLYKSGNLVFRVKTKIQNPDKTPLHVQSIFFGAYINSQVQNQNGKLTVISQGDLIASLTDATSFTINPNAVTEKEFFIEAKWSQIAQLLGLNITSLISIFTGGAAQQLQEIRNKLTNLKVLISGTVTAENYTIPINQLIQISNS